MAYRACAQIEIPREKLALHCLSKRLRDLLVAQGRSGRNTRALFPGYCFVAIEL
jgi:hypothetical protein